MRFAPLLVALPLLLTGCADSDDPQAPDSLPTVQVPSNCPTGPATEIPSACVSGQPDGPPKIPVDKFPKTSAEIPAVTVDAAPGDLARGGNEVDATLTTRSFQVTVPAGQRLEVTAACNGASFLETVTEPDSLAEVTMSCFAEEAGTSQLSVADNVVQKTAKTFTVKVTTAAPSRWYVAVGATNAPMPSDAG